MVDHRDDASALADAETPARLVEFRTLYVFMNGGRLALCDAHTERVDELVADGWALDYATSTVEECAVCEECDEQTVAEINAHTQ